MVTIHHLQIIIKLLKKKKQEKRTEKILHGN